MSSEDKINILLVDDRYDGLLALEVVLNSPRYNLIKAMSGAEALEKLKEYDVSVILLDVQMPKMDGFQTAAHIKEDERLKDIPIIFITAINKDDRYVQWGYEKGAVDYIFKPFEPEILRAKVAAFADLYLKTLRLKQQAELLRESERRERYLKLAEAELQSLKRYRSLADAMPQIVWKAFADGTVDYFNAFWSSYTGLSQDQSRGDGWQVAFHSEDLPRFLKKWVDAMKTGDSFDVECRIRSHKNEYRWHEVHLTADRDSYGKVLYWILTAVDVQDRRLMHEKLVQAKEIADAANQAKTHFLANMSHEIRTPLGAILGFTELLLTSKIPESEVRGIIATIQRNGASLLKIIDEILDIAKVEAGRLEIERLPLNLEGLFSDINDLFGVKAVEKDISLRFILESPVPSILITDPTRLRQLLTNLVGNAIKFTTKGKVELRVSWKSSGKEDEGTLHVDVADSGVGIPADKIGDLFQPFTQVDGSTSRRFGGTGLGLSLSRKIARALGGDVWISSSQMDVGSVFSFEIQAKIQPGVGMLESFNFEKVDNADNFKFSKSLLSGMKILLAEDSKDNQVLITYFLEMTGAEVEVADNGKKAVEYALKKDYDLVLMDIQMPEMDGYEATRALRKKGYSKPVVALTARALKEDKELCLQNGFTDHITKPVQGAALVREVAKYSAHPTVQ